MCLNEQHLTKNNNESAASASDQVVTTGVKQPKLRTGSVWKMTGKGFCFEHTRIVNQLEENIFWNLFLIGTVCNHRPPSK